MLTISKAHNLIFLHPLKCAGTSISAALEPYRDVTIPSHRAHETLDWCTTLLSEQEIRDFAKFTVVRNSWDRVVSGYFYFLSDPFRDLRVFHDISSTGFKGFVRRYALQRLRSQIDWMRFHGRRVHVTALKYQTIDEDFAIFCREHDLVCELPKLNITQDRVSCGDLYDSDTYAMVAELFAEEIEEFGFTYPDEPPSTQSLAFSALEREVIAKSQAKWRDAENIEGLDRAAIYMRFLACGDFESDTKNYGAALKHYTRALEYEPDQVPCLIGVAHCHYKLGNLSEALDFAQRAIQEDPREAVALALKGDILVQLGEIARAKEEYQQALAIDPKTALTGLATCNYKLGNLSEALDFAQWAVREDPGDTVALAVTGDILVQLGEIVRAEEAYRQALAIEPKKGWYLLGLAICLERRGALKEAMDAAVASVEANPNLQAAQDFVSFLETKNSSAGAN